MMKGKVPIKDVAEYDPNLNQMPGKPREKTGKPTSSGRVKGPKKHVVS